MIIYAKVNEIRPDRTPYKQYSPSLTVDNLYVEFEVDEAYVVNDGTGEDQRKVVTPAGYALMLAKLANTIDDIEELHQRNKFK